MLTTLPITISPDTGDLMNGIIDVRGVLRYDGSRIEIEYQTTADTIEYSPPQTIELDLAHVYRIEYRKSVFGHRLIFHTTSALHFQNVPGADGEKLAVRFQRKHRLLAGRLAWELQTTVEDRKLGKK